MRTRKKYIYLITNVLSGRDYISSAPVLGMHTNLKAAKEHYDLVVQHHREQVGSILHWETLDMDSGHYKELFVSYISNENTGKNRIALQRWEVKQKNKTQLLATTDSPYLPASNITMKKTS